MSFNTTANRKRPQTFESLKGQNFVVSTLESAIKNNRIAHAYLFSGPRGVGKTTSARLLAKALCCEKGPTSTPCGECDACKSITNGSAVDVIEIDGASNTSVDDVRDIKEELMFPPQYFRYKIYIIDEVHMLSTSAFNALLKTIEEPPEWAIFIFATTELQKVPQTIQSRCQCFRFKSIEEDTIVSLIKNAANDDNIKIDQESARWISKRARGSARDAYTIFDQCASFANGEITFEKIKNELGITGANELKDIFENSANGKIKDALLKVNTLYQKGVSAESFVQDMASYLRDVMLVHSNITNPNILYNLAEYYDTTLISTLSKNAIEEALDRFLELFRKIKYTLNAEYEIENEIVRLSNIKVSLTQNEIINKLEDLKNALVDESKAVNPELLLSLTESNNSAEFVMRNAELTGNSAKEENSTAHDDNTNDNSTKQENTKINDNKSEEIRDEKNEKMLEILKEKSAVLYQAYKTKASITFKDNTCTIGLTSAYALTEVHRPDNSRIILDALKTVYNYNGSVDYFLDKKEDTREKTKVDDLAAVFEGKVF